MKPVNVYSVILIPQLGQYLVTLEEKDGIRLIPIWVGPAEGMAIASKLDNEKFPRPLTHDLLANIMSEMESKIKHVIITDLKESTFYAKIIIKYQNQEKEIDARPSDAIALALRANADIFIDDIVLKKCPVIQKPISKTEIDDFKKKLKDLKPEDFFKED